MESGPVRLEIWLCIAAAGLRGCCDVAKKSSVNLPDPSAAHADSVLALLHASSKPIYGDRNSDDRPADRAVRGMRRIRISRRGRFILFFRNDADSQDGTVSESGSRDIGIDRP